MKGGEKGNETKTSWLKLILAGIPSSQPCKSQVARLRILQTHSKTLQASFYQKHWRVEPETCLHFRFHTSEVATKFLICSLKLGVVYLFCPSSAQLYSSCLLSLVCFCCKLSGRRILCTEKSVVAVVTKIIPSICLIIVIPIDKGAETSLRRERDGAQWLYTALIKTDLLKRAIAHQKEQFVTFSQFLKCF